MKRNITCEILILLIFIIQYHTLIASVINASSCSREDVQVAIDEANSGDTVMLPAGNVIWTTRVEILKGLTILGSGIGETIITKTGGSAAIYCVIYSEAFRFNGIELHGNNESIGLEIHGDPQDFRIDHNKFQECRTRAIVFYEGHQYGVIDHNEFIDNSTSDIAVYGDNDSAWIRPKDLGGPDFVFIEDNTFKYTGNGADPEHAIASNTGGKYVFRYNTINSIYRSDFHFAAPIDAHGYCYYKRGTRAYEVYENNIYSEHSYRGMNFRGGAGVIFNNSLTGEFTNPIHMTNYRSWTSCSGTDVEPDSCIEGYPCHDQIRELYIWNNTYNDDPIIATVDDRGFNTQHIVENWDYFLYEMPDYTPYTYPHPLVTGQDGTGLNEINPVRQIHVYPNPLSDISIIKFNCRYKCFIDIDIYDFTGKKIKNIESKKYSAGYHELKWNCNEMKSGLYLIKLSTNSHMTTKKIIILNSIF